LSAAKVLAQENSATKNEFRAYLIATVANIDWPTSNTDSVKKQQKDFIAILDTYKIKLQCSYCANTQCW
jgi:hypothetical protein